jgi:anti-anti-sigma factor
VTDHRYVGSVDITAEWEPQRVVLRLAGEIDSANASYLEDYLSLIVDQGEHNVLIDLTRLDFIDSAGIKAVATTAQRVAPAGGAVTLRSAPAVVRSMLAILELDRLVLVDGHGQPAVS